MQALTPEALVYGVARLGDAQMSPDGTAVLYTVSTADAATGATRTAIWRAPTDGSPPANLELPGDSLGCPRWAPDGSAFAFVRSDPAGGCIVLAGSADGAVRDVYQHDSALHDLAWSPDGRALAFVALPRGASKRVPVARVVHRLDYKQDSRGLLNDDRLQLHIVEVAAGEARQLTDEPLDHAFPAWSPDGRWIAVQVTTVTAMCFVLRLVSLTGEPSRTVGSERGKVGTFAWSPDGGRILFSAEPVRTWQPEFFEYHLASDSVRHVTEGLDCVPVSGLPALSAPSQPTWLDGNTVVFHAMRRGASGTHRLDVNTGAVTTLHEAESVASGMSMDSARQLVAHVVATPGAPGEMAIVDIGGTRRTLTTHNAALLRERSPAAWEAVGVERDGWEIEGWLLKPPGFDPSRRYPLVLSVHGGPNYYWGYGFEPIHQCLATHGCLVLYLNPRGSATYGREFATTVLRDWGGDDYHDLMAVLDLVAERPYVDPARVGIVGHSYGGYMTAWATAHSDRFAAAVAAAPAFHLASMYGTSDIGPVFGNLHWGGPPHEHREWYEAHSPSTFAHQSRTPTLILHGEADEDCPIGQGEEMFTALKVAGCEVEFVRYADATHLFLEAGPAALRADALGRIVAWFQRWLG